MTHIACSVTPESYAADQERGSIQTVVAIARNDARNGGTQADALAGFVRLPAATDRAAALDLAGLGLHLPEIGHCWQGEPARSAAGQLDDVSTLELLDAGRVRLVADGDAPHELAPHAFPSVADFISGVLYTSRERSGAELPPDRIYRLEAEGGAVGSLTLEQAAPPVLSDITAGGVPLEAVEVLQVDQPLDLTWSPGSDPNDRVYVELTGAGSGLLCTFEDAAGTGTLPLSELLDKPGTEKREMEGHDAQLSLHRLRVIRAAAHGAAVNQIELRFDFSVGQAVELTHPSR